jgi:hypothetical protein
MAKFFRFPWATTGDKTAIPDPTDGGGAVSYSQGFGPDYERDPVTDPLAKRVPRAETNQYIFDITDNLRQYQINGIPEWYDASNNGGVAINYPINAQVRHTDLVYRSIVANNTVEPGTDVDSWVVDFAFTGPARKNPYFISTGSSDQSISTGVNTKVTNLGAPASSFLSAGSSFGSAEFTCGAEDAGAWLFTGYAAMTLLTPSAGGNDYRISIALNGVTGPFMTAYVKESSIYGSSITQPFVVSEGDVVSLSVLQNTGDLRNINSTQLSGIRWGAA